MPSLCSDRPTRRRTAPRRTPTWTLQEGPYQAENQGDETHDEAHEQAILRLLVPGGPGAGELLAVEELLACYPALVLVPVWKSHALDAALVHHPAGAVGELHGVPPFVCHGLHRDIIDTAQQLPIIDPEPDPRAAEWVSPLLLRRQGQVVWVPALPWPPVLLCALSDHGELCHRLIRAPDVAHELGAVHHCRAVDEAHLGRRDAQGDLQRIEHVSDGPAALRKDAAGCAAQRAAPELDGPHGRGGARGQDAVGGSGRCEKGAGVR
eukprot:CAMPEP_0179078586 /NCGR_PEP_ID=MMETSP0796-20121207/35204_1 /TAXON_ID=73915 /ORGANISM="Pyrodinium bahamense, Strain pbaha01" /LENGTH=264 /DNA_ID=CAMNT_0020775897 /DNA_START=72 /DNA_END=863 /DNA_ORIENTATION=+